MGSLFAKMIPLGLAAAVSPTMLATSLFILSLKDRPRERLAVYIAGVALAVVLIGAIAVSVGGIASAKTNSHSRISGSIDLILGFSLIFFGIRNFAKKLLVKKEGEPHQSRIMNRIEGSGIISFFFTGVFMMATNFSSLVFYLAAAKESADSRLGIPTESAAMAIVAFFILLPAIIPLTFAVLAPGAADRITDSLNKLISRYGMYMGPIIALFFGVYLLYEGVKTIG